MPVVHLQRGSRGAKNALEFGPELGQSLETLGNLYLPQACLFPGRISCKLSETVKIMACGYAHACIQPRGSHNWLEIECASFGSKTVIRSGRYLGIPLQTDPGPRRP